MQDTFDDFSVKSSGKSILTKSPLLLRGCVFAFWVVMSLTILSSSVIAPPPPMCENVSVSFVELEKSIVNHAYNFTVSSSDGIDCKIDLINIINETNPNFHANKTFDDKLWEWKNISHNVTIPNYSNFTLNLTCNVAWYPNQSLYTCTDLPPNSTALTRACDYLLNETIENDTCVWNETWMNGSHAEEQYWYDWKKCKMYLLTNNKKIFRKKMNGTIVIPENESKVFKYEFKTPITINQLAWGSKGIFHVEINNQTFEDLSDSSWWNESWNYRRRINVTNNNLTHSLPVGYPINFTINTSGFKFMDNGSDVRIIYNGTGADVELSIFNETAFNISFTNIFFALNTSISADSSDLSYWIYYHYNQSSSMPDINETAVKGYKSDSNTIVLYHFDLDSTVSNVVDSGPNSYDATLYNSSGLGDYKNFTSYITQGLHFNKTNETYAYKTAEVEFNTSSMTIEVWVNMSGNWSNNPGIVSRWWSDLNWIFFFHNKTSTMIDTLVWQPASAGASLRYGFDMATYENKTIHLAVIHNGTTQMSKLYYDGEMVNSSTIVPIENGTDPLSIAGRRNNEIYLDAGLDELRISNKVRNPIEMYFAHPIPTITLGNEEAVWKANLIIGTIDLKKEGDPGYFWANYSYKKNSTTILNASCNITITGGIPAANNQPISYYSPLDMYRYNYTPNDNVVYTYTINCTRTLVENRTNTSTVVISSKGGGGGTAGGGTGSTFTIYYTAGITANPEALNFETSTGLIVSKDLEICLEGGSDLVTFKSGIAWLTAPNGDNIDKDACKTFSVRVNTVNMIEGEFNTTLQVFRGGDLAINVPVSLRVGGEANISAMLFGDMDTRNMLILGGIAALIYFGRKKGKRGWKI